jgi:outer membrane protein assembly factor BamB
VVEKPGAAVNRRVGIMPTPSPTEHSPARSLRLWPGVAAAVLLVAVSYVLPRIAPDAMLLGIPLAMIGLLGGVVMAVVVILWWLLFSRAPWLERLGALALMIAAVAGTRLLIDESMAGAGMGVLYFIYAIPGMSLAFVVWAVASRPLSGRARRASMAATILLSCGVWALVRTGGIHGGGTSDFHWRWTPTPEERLLTQTRDEVLTPGPMVGAVPEQPVEEARPVAPGPGPIAAEAGKRLLEETAEGDRPRPAARAGERLPISDPLVLRAEWPGFRGPHRDSVVRGVRIRTDWAASPPIELWRRPIGPGWSSFAVDGGLLFTQEQRGDHESVAAYRVGTGEPVWRHRDTVRFYESNGGAGPRATPTVHDGRVYTLGATGILNVLDAATGAVVWSRNAATDTDRTIPDWGIASSPLILDDLVIVAVAGHLAAYGVGTGAPRWFGPTGGGGYSSPHPATIDGVPQILLLRGSRTISVAVADGTLLWDHTWQPGVSIVQPAFTEDGDVLVAGGDTMGGLGIRRLAVRHGEGGWTVEERWTSRGLKPYFNDFVVHAGHAYGFDGSILACLDLADGARKWKGGRYGHGQLVLLPDQDVLLVLSEDGEIAVVSATPERFQELARIPALTGKTWNHPVLAGDVLLVRNGEEMAAFRLSLDGR